MPVITIKVKAKQYPIWHYVIAAVLAFVGSSFWAWVAYLAGFGLSAARQVLFVFGGLQLLLVPSLYFANEKRFRDHNSKAVQWVAAGFIGSISFAIIYFLAVHDLRSGGDSTTTLLTVVISLVSIVAGLLFSLFGIKYEVD
jgi:drug/metabolite transporter (DMT)-like permease